MTVEDTERIEEERKNFESARDFQRMANEEHYKERAEIENQTDQQFNLSNDSPPLAGMDERSNLNQTKSVQTVSKQNQTKVQSHKSLSNLVQTVSLQTALLNQKQTEDSGDENLIGVDTNVQSEDATKGTPSVNQEGNKEKEKVPLNASLGAVSTTQLDQTAEVVQSVLNKQDVLDIANSSQVKRKRPISLMNTLQGYTSPGGGDDMDHPRTCDLAHHVRSG